MTERGQLGAGPHRPEHPAGTIRGGPAVGGRAGEPGGRLGQLRDPLGDPVLTEIAQVRAERVGGDAVRARVQVSLVNRRLRYRAGSRSGSRCSPRSSRSRRRWRRWPGALCPSPRRPPRLAQPGRFVACSLPPNHRQVIVGVPCGLPYPSADTPPGNPISEDDHVGCNRTARASAWEVASYRVQRHRRTHIAGRHCRIRGLERRGRGGERGSQPPGHRLAGDSHRRHRSRGFLRLPGQPAGGRDRRRADPAADLADDQDLRRPRAAGRRIRAAQPGCPATWSWCTASSRTCAGGRSARNWCRAWRASASR